MFSEIIVGRWADVEIDDSDCQCRNDISAKEVDVVAVVYR